ncbi:hypothetical protein Taro_022953 [Colocasia esculenta]|uniref:Uncharacterized protein n=1 Tax=Colocasia esculenta TaxID=4460 RepID=A0A843V2M8_COLES|nr:hypothetical protein [Colocasia esculenta]
MKATQAHVANTAKWSEFALHSGQTFGAASQRCWTSTSSSVVSFLSCTSLPRGMPQAPVLLCTFVEIWLCKSCTLYMSWCVPLCFTDVCMISLARLRPVRGRRTWIKFVSGLTGLNEAFHHSWYQNKVREVEMADRRDWGGGGEDPEESTYHMIERIWESVTDIRMRMDQQAPIPLTAVPPVAEVPVAPVAPPPRVEVPYVAPVPPPVMAAEEPVCSFVFHGRVYDIPCEASARSWEADSNQVR